MNKRIDQKVIAFFRKLTRNLVILIFIMTLGISNVLSGNALQERTITGTVTDARTDEPLPGVNVVISGTTIGTVTDIDGQYSIAVPGPDVGLTFSFVGYTSVTMAVEDRTVIDIELPASTMDLDEVIVVGYGTVRRSDLTGSVTRVNMDAKATQPNVNLLQALAGSSAGVNVSGSGGAGGQPSLTVRGRTTLSASQYPLIVLDGIIYNGSLASINVNDVETIDILKDASAAAVYGSRAANGVLLITTKSGKTEKPVFGFDMYYGYQDMTNNPMRVMNADEFAVRLVDFEHQREVYEWYATNPAGPEGRPVRPDVTNRNLVGNYLRTQEERDNYLAGNEIDWVDEVLQIAPIQNYNLNVSGQAAEAVNYYISTSYTDTEGIQLNDQFKRFTLNSNLDTDINEWIFLGLRSTYSYRDYSGIPANLTAARVASPLVNNYIGQPSYDIFLGGELFQPYPLVNTYIDNSNIQNQLNITGTTRVKIPWVEGLSNEFNYSQRYANNNNNSYHNYNTPSGVVNRGLATKSPSETRDWIINNIITYQRGFGDHNINTTLLYSREARHGNASSLRAQGFDNEILGYNNMGLGEIQINSTSAWEENSISYMARASYSYLARYMFTATFRRDGYSGFGAGNKWADFPSASIAWVASDEDFMVNMPVYLKLRASYGLNGNQGIGRYSSLARMSTRYYVYGSSTAIGLNPSTLGNASLGWEATSSFNIGVDYGFMNNRITGSLDVYTAETKDVLVRRNLPRATGYASVFANIGGIANKGIELELRSLNLDRQAFRWESAFVFSLNRDEITRLYGEEDDADVGNQWFVGEPISAIYDYEMAGGVWTEDEFFAGEIPFQGWYPGQFRYVDQNDDGILDPTNDRTIIGYSAPSYRFSINNTLTYGNWTLNLFINSIQGGDNYYLQNNADRINPLYYMEFRRNNSAINRYWRPDDPTTNTTGMYNVPPRQSGIYQSRSFVRIQDVSIGYNFDQQVLNTLNLDGLQVYISSKNPYVWTEWQGWDPETGTSDTPLMRNITAGLRVNF